MNPLEIPHLTRYVNDFSHIFSEDQKNTLDTLFSSHEKKTTEQVVTVFIPHREGNELLDIGLKLFNENGIGQKNLNNGLLLMVSTEEKKLRIIVGKGLELKYTEMICRDIVENHLRPLLNAGKYEEMVRKWGEIIVRSGKVNKTLSNNTRDGFGNIVSSFFLFCLLPIVPLIIAGVTLEEIATVIITAGNSAIILGIIIIGLLFSASIADSYKKNIRIGIFIKIFSVFISGSILTCIFLNHSPRTCEEVATQEIITSTCSRTVYGKTYTKTSYKYTESYKITHPEQFTSSSSSDSSSSSFDGGGGSSNGGGYGD